MSHTLATPTPIPWLARAGKVVVAAGRSPALWLAAPSALLFLVFFVAPLAGLAWQDVGLHAVTGFVALAVGFVLFSQGWIGGGDAKLFAGAALWLGPTLMLEYVVLAGLLGGALSLVILKMREVALPASWLGENWLARLHDKKQGIPYGIALAGAAMIVYPDSPLMAALGA